MEGLGWTVQSRVESRCREDVGEAEREATKAGKELEKNHRRTHLTLISVVFLMKMWC